MNMNHREFAKLSATLGMCAIVPMPELKPDASKFGLVTAETHMGKVKVFLNGEDVTHRTFAADDVIGYVDRYKSYRDGKIYVDPSTGSAAKERIYGDVVIKGI